MGMTDAFIIPEYAELVGSYINKKLSAGSKIAWLGQQPPGNYSDMFDEINKRVSVEGIEHHFYDIEECKDASGYRFTRWDVHSSWDGVVEGYDLVLGIRLAYLVQSSSGLIENLKYAVDNNEAVMFDFNTGNLFDKGGRYFQTWKRGSTNLIPHFPDLYPKGMDYHVSDNEHLLTMQMLQDSGLFFKNPKIIQDPIKRRFYTITEITKLCN